MSVSLPYKQLASNKSYEFRITVNHVEPGIEQELLSRFLTTAGNFSQTVGRGKKPNEFIFQLDYTPVIPFVVILKTDNIKIKDDKFLIGWRVTHNKKFMPFDYGRIPLNKLDAFQKHPFYSDIDYLTTVGGFDERVKALQDEAAAHTGSSSGTNDDDNYNPAAQQNSSLNSDSDDEEEDDDSQPVGRGKSTMVIQDDDDSDATDSPDEDMGSNVNSAEGSISSSFYKDPGGIQNEDATDRPNKRKRSDDSPLVLESENSANQGGDPQLQNEEGSPESIDQSGEAEESEKSLNQLAKNGKEIQATSGSSQITLETENTPKSRNDWIAAMKKIVPEIEDEAIVTFDLKAIVDTPEENDVYVFQNFDNFPKDIRVFFDDSLQEINKSSYDRKNILKIIKNVKDDNWRQEVKNYVESFPPQNNQFFLNDEGELQSQGSDEEFHSEGEGSPNQEGAPSIQRFVNGQRLAELEGDEESQPENQMGSREYLEAIGELKQSPEEVGKQLLEENRQIAASQFADRAGKRQNIDASSTKKCEDMALKEKSVQVLEDMRAEKESYLDVVKQIIRDLKGSLSKIEEDQNSRIQLIDKQIVMKNQIPMRVQEQIDEAVRNIKEKGEKEKNQIQQRIDELEKEVADLKVQEAEEEEKKGPQIQKWNSELEKSSTVIECIESELKRKAEAEEALKKAETDLEELQKKFAEMQKQIAEKQRIAEEAKKVLS